MRVFFIGYMGCGKSRWGKIIARHYGFKFIDLDTLIEEREGVSISCLFERYGEAGFREREHEALKSISNEENVIVATGGGAPCFYNNMEVMKTLGITLFINGSPGLLRDRIVGSNSERPLVKSLSREKLLDYIERNLQIRMPFYAQADYQVTSGGLQLKDFTDLLDSVIGV